MRLARRFNAGFSRAGAKSQRDGRLLLAALGRPFGTWRLLCASPALKCRANVVRPSGTLHRLADTLKNCDVPIFAVDPGRERGRFRERFN